MNTEIEIWKDIPGYEGLYQVSNTGSVKSLFRYKKILKPKIDRGYEIFILYKNKLTKHIGGHRLVASAFLGLNIKNRKEFACHKNDIPNDNRVENLFVGDAIVNVRDMVSKGRGVDNKGTKNGMNKYEKDKIIHVKKLIQEGYRNIEIERMIGVNNRTVSDIRYGKRWGWLKLEV